MKDKREKSFFKRFCEEVKYIFTHPKKLIPAIVLGVIWIALAIMSALLKDIQFIKILSSITYANGGMYGGVLGTVGGIFGKAVFAAFITGTVNAICEKRNPFKNCGKGIRALFGSGLQAVNPFLMGAGAGLIIYWFFNVTSNPVNCAVAVAGAVSAIMAIGRQNGILFSLLFGIIGKISQGRTPSYVTTGRVMAGLSAGFVIGMPLTLARRGWILLTAGGVLMVTSIVLIIVQSAKTKGGKQAAAVAMLALIMLGFILPAATVYAEEEFSDGFVKPERVFEYKKGKGGKIMDMNGWWEKCDEFYFEIPAEGVFPSDLLQYTLETYFHFYTGTEKMGKMQVTMEPFVISYESPNTGMHVTGKAHGAFSCTEANYFRDVGDSIVIDYSFDVRLTDITVSRDIETYLFTYSYSGTQTVVFNINSKESDSGENGYTRNLDGMSTAGFNTPKGEDVFINLYMGGPAINPVLAAVKPAKGVKLLPVGKKADDDEEDEEAEDVGTVVLISFSTGAGGTVIGIIVVALTEAIGGAAGGASGGAAGGAAGAGGGIEGNPYISRDSDGDINVTDPVTGERRTYVSNGDGTYTNPLTGATYNEGGLISSAESREENADVLSKDEAAKNAAISKQRDDNQQLSEGARIYSEQKKQLEEEYKHEKNVETMWLKYGGDKDDEASIMKAAQEAQDKNKASADFWNARGDRMEFAEKAASVTVVVADTGVDVLSNMTGPAGKAIKNVYIVGKNTASRLSDAVVNMDPNLTPEEKKMKLQGAIAMAGFDSIADIGVNQLESIGCHVSGNVAGDVFKKGMQNLYEGKDFTENLGQAAVSGAVKGSMAKMGELFTGNSKDLLKEQMKSDAKLIKYTANSVYPKKSLEPLIAARCTTITNNLHAIKVSEGIATVVVDTGKTVTDGVSDAYSNIREQFGGNK